VKKATSRAELEILQLELWLEPARLGLITTIYQENGPNGLNWQCCLAGSSKTAPRILIFSMAMDADYSFELIFNEACAPQFK
jgi:hypothetical protein